MGLGRAGQSSPPTASTKTKSQPTTSTISALPVKAKFGVASNWSRDSGIEYGLRAQLRFQSSEAEFSNDFVRGAPEFVDEVWAYVQTAFGRLRRGP